jgi:hypothetical protein
MKKIAIVLMLISCNAMAGNFWTRVTAGNSAIATPEGKTYDASLVPFIQATMHICVPPGSPPKSSLGKFVLVGDVDASGHLSSVATKPSTHVSRCFARKFGTSPLPVPPLSGRWGKAYPVVVEVTVTP